MLQFLFSDNHVNMLRNKEARAKVLEFIDHPSYDHLLSDKCLGTIDITLSKYFKCHQSLAVKI